MKLFNFPVLINNIREKNNNQTGRVIGADKKILKFLKLTLEKGKKLKLV